METPLISIVMAVYNTGVHNLLGKLRKKKRNYASQLNQF